MSNQKCETCKHYMPEPIVKMEGSCLEPSKIIYVAGDPENAPPHVFNFSWCLNHSIDK